MLRGLRPMGRLSTPIAVILLLTACGGGPSISCDDPSNIERLYPFTGRWEDPGAPRSVLCLYQRSPEAVDGIGPYGTISGAVAPSGELTLTMGDEARGVRYVLRLQDSTTLMVMSSEATGVKNNPPETFMRR